MMDHQRMAVWLASVLLAGCSAEPSEADMKKAFEAEFSQAKATVGLAPKFYGLKKLGCAKAESNPGYNCDVELDLEVFNTRAKNAVKVRFVKGDDGWVPIKEQR